MFFTNVKPYLEIIFRRKVGALQSRDHPHRVKRKAGVGQRAIRHRVARGDDHDLRAICDVLDDHADLPPPRGAERFVQRLEVEPHEVEVSVDHPRPCFGAVMV